MTAPSGRQWKTWKKLSEISYHHPGLNGNTWMRYLGVWGQTHGTPTSPYGPAAKSTFYKGDKS